MSIFYPFATEPHILCYNSSKSKYHLCFLGINRMQDSFARYFLSHLLSKFNSTEKGGNSISKIGEEEMSVFVSENGREREREMCQIWLLGAKNVFVCMVNTNRTLWKVNYYWGAVGRKTKHYTFNALQCGMCVYLYVYMGNWVTQCHVRLSGVRNMRVRFVHSATRAFAIPSGLFPWWGLILQFTSSIYLFLHVSQQLAIAWALRIMRSFCHYRCGHTLPWIRAGTIVCYSARMWRT